MITSIQEFKIFLESKINETKSPEPKFKAFEPKDKMRIDDILTKSDRMAKRKTGNFTAVKNDKEKIKEEEIAKAQQMANAITDYNKALRRGNAAKSLGKEDIASVFYKRAKDLQDKK